MPGFTPHYSKLLLTHLCNLDLLCVCVCVVCERERELETYSETGLLISVHLFRDAQLCIGTMLGNFYFPRFIVICEITGYYINRANDSFHLSKCSKKEKRKKNCVL